MLLKIHYNVDNHEQGDSLAQQRIRQLWWNWALVILGSIYVYSGWVITFPTLYQYLTNPTNTTCGHAGLGESELVYSIAVAIYSGGELLGSLISATVPHTIGFSVVFFIGVVLQTICFLFYGLSNAGWMIIIARLLLGIHGGIILALVPSYFSWSGEEYNALRETQGKKRDVGLKAHLILAWGLNLSISTISTLGIVLGVAQFDGVNQFLWIAWFQVSCGIAITVLMLLFFRDKVLLPSFSFCDWISWSRARRKTSTASTATLKPNISQPIKPMVIFTILYLMFTGYTLDCYLSIVETLGNPILTDYFGMSSDTQTYFFLGVTSLLPLVLIVMLILDRLAVDTRSLLISTFIFSTVGLLLLSDWQTISPDPCNNFSLPEYSVSEEHLTACISANCVPFHLNVSSDCPAEEQFLKAIGLSESSSYVTIYSYADQPWTISDQQTSASVTVSQCPPCSNFTGSSCLVASVASGFMCVVEDRSSGNGNSYQSYSFTLPDYQSQLCLSVAENVDLQLPSFSRNCTSLPASFLSLTNSLPQTDTLKAHQECKSHSFPPDNCYWVQDSIITGQHCVNCAPLCRSTKKIPHFAQVFVAIACLMIATCSGRCVSCILMVKISPVWILPISTGLLVFMQGFARLTTPFWVNLVYVAVGRHTLIPVAIMIICQIPVYLGLCILWKTLRGTSLPPKDGNEGIPMGNAEGMERYLKEGKAGDEKQKETQAPVKELIYVVTSL